MHEGVFTQQIVSAILAQVDRQSGKNIDKVKVKVGETYHLVAPSVQMHFAVAVQGTALKDAVLEIEEEPLRVMCAQCHRSGTVEDHHMPMCGFCGSFHVKTIGGNAITIETIEFSEQRME